MDRQQEPPGAFRIAPVTKGFIMTMYYPCPLGQPAPSSTTRRLTVLALLAMLLPLAGAVGYGLDTIRGCIVQAKLSRAVDEAALAGGRVLFENQRDGHIRKFFETAFPAGFLGAEPAPLAIADNPQDGTLTVRGRATVRAGFLALLGVGDVVVEARSVVRRATPKTSS